MFNFNFRETTRKAFFIVLATLIAINLLDSISNHLKEISNELKKLNDNYDSRRITENESLQ